MKFYRADLEHIMEQFEPRPEGRGDVILQELADIIVPTFPALGTVKLDLLETSNDNGSATQANVGPVPLGFIQYVFAAHGNNSEAVSRKCRLGVIDGSVAGLETILVTGLLAAADEFLVLPRPIILGPNCRLRFTVVGGAGSTNLKALGLKVPVGEVVGWV